MASVSKRPKVGSAMRSTLSSSSHLLHYLSPTTYPWLALLGHPKHLFFIHPTSHLKSSTAPTSPSSPTHHHGPRTFHNTIHIPLPTHSAPHSPFKIRTTTHSLHPTKPHHPPLSYPLPQPPLSIRRDYPQPRDPPWNRLPATMQANLRPAPNCCANGGDSNATRRLCTTLP